MTEHEQLVLLCQKLGASPAQAETMARQLSKRADQRAREGACTREEAMAQLLELVVRGRSGVGPDGPAAGQAADG